MVVNMVSKEVPTPDSSSDMEKVDAVVMIESASSSSSDFGYDEKADKKLVRKIDLNLIPFLSILYLLSYLDRTNIGNARLGGLEASLGMKGLDYNIALAIFFPTYVLAEIPSNMMLKKTKPSIWIPSIMVAWAICTTLMGISQNFHGLLAVRAILGLTEGGLFPGVAFMITLWYKKHECAFRIALFYSAATAAGAFGGLLARGIMTMNGFAGLAGWRWLFIIEGLITFLVALLAYRFMNDYPGTARFLNDDERKEVVRRLKADHDGLAEEFDLQYFWDAIKDWKIYVHMIITICIYTSNYSVSLFLPTIIKSLGYTNNTAQLMTVPPYVIACVSCITGGFIGDKLKQRGIPMICYCLISMTGLVMLLISHDNHVKYGAVFLVTSGFFPNVPLGAAWQSNNNGGALKRGVALAMHVGFGNLGGVLASFIFLSKWAPQFVPGLSVLIGLNGLAVVLCIIMSIYYRRENARRDREYKAPSEYTEAEKALERTRGDYATYFRYTY